MSVEIFDSSDTYARADGLDVGAVLDAQLERVGWDRSDAMIDEWGRQSFPASDPPSNW